MPARRDIDPVDIPRVLPYILMLDVMEAPGFRYRLVGTTVVDGVGHDPTGREMADSFPADYGRALEALYEGVRVARVPGFGISTVDGARGPERLCTRLILPLASDGRTVDKIIATSIFDQRFIRYSLPDLSNRLDTHRTELILDTESSPPQMS